ncbi:MAG: PA14 domain-containing protein, partial [Vicinamibacterales bacterium]
MLPRRAELLVLLVVAVLSGVAAWLLPHHTTPGLVGRYWDSRDWTGTPVVERLGAVPRTADLQRALPRLAVDGGSAEWSGFLLVDTPGPVRLEIASDDGAWLWLDDALVVDNGGEHGVQTAGADLELTAGAHPVRVRYFQGAGDFALQVFLTRPGGRRRLVEADQLAPSAEVAALGDRRRWVRGAAVAVPVIWAVLLLYLPVRVIGAWMWREVRRLAPDARERSGLVLMLVLATALMVWGLDWGIGDAWAADELSPGYVRDLIAHHGAGGWYDKYPILHYLVLALPVGAFELADRVGLLSADASASFFAQLASMRAVSVVTGLGAVTAIFLCAAELIGSRRAVLATLPLVLTPLFLYYGKIANLDVPSLCW